MMGNFCDLKKAAALFEEFCRTIARLREPKTGCPWDLQQDFDSLRPFMLEEAYEASEALASHDAKEIYSELGDVLLQVVLNAQVGFDRKEFSIIDVISSINEKMIRRHPHVFVDRKDVDSPEKVLAQWKVIKDNEKKDKEARIFAKAEKSIPATRQALEIGKIAHKISFDWGRSSEVFDKFTSEIKELGDALNKNGFVATEDVKAELGDVYFTLAQLCRHLACDPETIAWDGNKKFLDRFSIMEQFARKRGIDLKSSSQEQLEKLWEEAKLAELQQG